MIKLEMNLCFILICFIIETPRYLSQTAYPFPALLKLNTACTSNLYPAYVKYENNEYILTKCASYLLSHNSTGYRVTPDSTAFSSFPLTRFYDNYTMARNGDTNVYVFPYINQKIIIRSVTNGAEVKNELPILQSIDGVTVDTCVFKNNSISLSYLDQRGYGKYYLIDPATASIIAETQNDTTLSLVGKFSCKQFYPNEVNYCFYVTNSIRVFYMKNYGSYYEQSKVFSTQIPSNSETFCNVKVEAIPDNKGIGVVYNSYNNKLYFIKLGAEPDTMRFIGKMETNINNYDANAMDLIVLNGYFMVTAFNSTSTICRFFDFEFNELGLVPYKECGQREMRASLSDNGKYLNFLYPNLNANTLNQMYFIQYQILTCKNKTYQISTNTPFVIAIEDMVEEEELNFLLREQSGFYFGRASDSDTLKLGTLIEVDSSGEQISIPVYYNTNKFYHRLKYTPQKVGREGYEYQIFTSITDVFAIPTLHCSFYFETSCYSTCGSCTAIGNSEDHKCSTCKEGYAFLENTQNCLDGTEEGYFLNQTTGMYNQCGINCKVCINTVSCSQCKDGMYKMEGANSCARVYNDGFGNIPLGFDYYYFNQESLTFKHCKSNCRKCYDASDCVYCENGAYKIANTDDCYYLPQPGYYYDSISNQLYPCADHCELCTQTSCTSCFSGSYFLEGTNDCYSSKPPNHYLDQETGTYRQCGQYCSVCKDENTCITCEDGALKVQGRDYCTYDSPGDNYHLDFDEGIYKQCTNDCDFCMGIPCYCASGSYLIGDLGTCASTPPDGYYFDSKDQIIMPCPEGCSECSKSGFDMTCTQCGDGTYLIEGTTNCVSQPSEGYYFDSDTGTIKKCGINCSSCNALSCLACKDNNYPVEGTQNCNSSPPSGYYFDEENQEIKQCGSNCLTCPNSLSCTRCDSGSYPIENESNCYSSPPDGYYLDETDSTYKSCGQNCLHCTNSLICTECEDNSYYAEGTKICYNTSPPGYFFDQSSNIYKECGENCAVCADANSCTTCDTNYYKMEGTGNCYDEAPPGYYFDQDNNMYKACSLYCAMCNSIECIRCESGAYFMEGTNNCYNQPPSGYYLDPIESVYKPCQLHCVQCTSSSCIECENGYVFQRIYTKASDDSQCVIECDGDNDRFYFDNNMNFVCLKDQNTCPTEYQCYNQETRECYHCDTPDNPNPDEPNPDNPNPDNPNPDEPNPDNPNPDEPNPDDPNPDNPNPDEPNPDDPSNPDKPNPDDPSNPDKPNPDDPNNPNQKPDPGHKNPSIDEIKDIIEKDILNHYNKNFSTSNDEYTSIVYDTSKDPNDIINNPDTPVSVIDLGKCGELLNIDLEKNPLIIMQIEKKNITSSSDKLLYEFYTQDGQKVDLSVCENSTMYISSPLPIPKSTDENDEESIQLTNQIEQLAKLSQKGINVYNISQPFYYDICNPFTSPINGKDVLVKDRIKAFYPTINVCANGCTFIELINNDSYAQCECNVTKSNEIADEFDPILESKKYQYQHIKIFKCANELFSNSIGQNAGNYVMLLFFILQIVNFVLYMIFKDKIFESYHSKNRKEYNQRQHRNFKLDLTAEDDKVIESTENNNSVTNNTASATKTIMFSNNVNAFMNLNQSKFNNSNNNIFVYSNSNSNKDLSEKESIKSVSDIDSMSFPEYKKEKYSLLSVFVLRLKQFNLFYIAFFEKDPLKIIYLYNAAFILEIQMIFFFNTFCYFDKYISKTFYNGYKFANQLGSNFLSTMLSMFIVFFIKFLIINLPNQKEVLKSKDKNKFVFQENRCEQIKTYTYLYFSIILVLSVFNWYYVSVFTAVFINTQGYLLYGCIASIIFYFILLILIAFTTALMRVVSVSSDLENLYNINRYFEKF